MRILQLGKYYPPVHGGMERVVSELAEGFARAGHEVGVLCAGARIGTQHEFKNGVEVTRVKTWGRAFGQPLLAGLHAEVKKFKPDVLHVHLPNPLALAALNKIDVPLILTLHARVEGFRGIIDRSWTRRYFQKASALVFSSEVERKAWEPAFSTPSFTIPFGFRYSTLPELGVQREPNLLLAVGRLVDYKGHAVLIEAMNSVRDAKLIVVGEGARRKQLELSAKNFGDRIEFVGAISDFELASLYQRASIFVQSSTSTSEAFGIAALEAMHFGCPVVSTDLRSGVQSVNQHLKSGFTVPPGHPRVLAAAINVLLQDSALAKRMAQGAKAQAATFNFSRMIEAHLDLYESLGAGKSSAIYDQLAEPIR